MERKIKNKLLYIVIFIVSILMTAIPLALDYNFVSNKVMTQGVITNITATTSHRRRSLPSKVYIVEVNFQVDGKEYTGELLYGNYPESSMVDIAYNRNNPNDFTNDFNTRASAEFIVFLFGSLLLFTQIIINNINNNGKYDTYGEILEAETKKTKKTLFTFIITFCATLIIIFAQIFNNGILTIPIFTIIVLYFISSLCICTGEIIYLISLSNKKKNSIYPIISSINITKNPIKVYLDEEYLVDFSRKFIKINYDDIASLEVLEKNTTSKIHVIYILVTTKNNTNIVIARSGIVKDKKQHLDIVERIKERMK